MKKPALVYRQFSVQGATPLGLVAMLYDGAITYLERTAAAIEAKDIKEKCAHLKRAQAIIGQLEGTLNFQQGGEAARNLKSFYAHARARLLKANLENSSQILRALIEEFTTLRDAWRQAERLQTLQETAPPPEEHRAPPPPRRSRSQYASSENDWDDAGTARLSIIE